MTDSERLGLSEAWRTAANVAFQGSTFGRGNNVQHAADAAVRVVLEHLIEEADVLVIPAVATAYMKRLLEEIHGC